MEGVFLIVSVVVAAVNLCPMQYACAQAAGSGALPVELPLTVVAPERRAGVSSQPLCPGPELKKRAVEEILTEVHDILEESVIPRFGLECVYGKCPENPASSCQELATFQPSGNYWVLNSTGSPVHVYCDMETRCGNGNGWIRVGFLNTSDTLDRLSCPNGLRVYSDDSNPRQRPSCGRPSDQEGCISLHYLAQGIEFTQVCGRVIGYQYKFTNAFRPYYKDPSAITIDDTYVDGVSVTYGNSPRKHIWTFAAAIDETRSNSASCPCIQVGVDFEGLVPPFVGDDYFCDTGSADEVRPWFYPDNPLWDGDGCGGNSSCCRFNDPPWFHKELSNSTTDDIELRMCGDQPGNREDTPIQLIEIYMQ